MVPYAELAVDAGFASREEAEAAGVRIGTPVTYRRGSSSWPAAASPGPPWTTGPDAPRCSPWPRRAGASPGPTLHLVWSVQEEHNLRGVLPAATSLAPDIAIAIDLMLACDTPEMAAAATSPSAAGRPCRCSRSTGAARSTASSRIRLWCVSWRPPPAAGLPLQRSAHIGALTDLSYIQFQGDLGVAAWTWASRALLAPGARGRGPSRRRGTRDPARRRARPHHAGLELVRAP